MIIIADDITGAAEIAGIAFSQGQAVRLVCAGGIVSCYNMATDGITVIATDTRSMTEGEAAAETQHIASSLLVPRPSSLFKKTDSALRGHVIAELTALMAATGYQRAVYMPANPSKGRIIRGGIYYIEEGGRRNEERLRPLHLTDFSFDPEFPARTSVLKERFPDAEGKGIIMPDAETMNDIRHIIAAYDDGKTLFAGAADLYESLAPAPPKGRGVLASANSPLSSGGVRGRLILCGSTQSRPLTLGIPIAPMPREIYDGSTDLSLWDTSNYDATHGLILTIPYTHRTGKDVAVHCRTMMARKAKELITQNLPATGVKTGEDLHLIIEGGATAWATLQALGWSEFDIVRQVAPGVVQMRSATSRTLVTLKPGSYPWGHLFDSFR